MKLQSRNNTYYENTIKKEQILNYQLELWCSLLGFTIKVGEKFCNPWRLDNHPHVFLKYNNDGILLMWDNGDYRYKGVSVFEIGKKNYNCTYKRFLQIAYYDILKNYNIPEQKFFNTTIKKKAYPNKFVIKTKSRAWNETDKKLWCIGGITLDILNKEKILPIQTYWTRDLKSNRGILRLFRCTRPTYALHIKDKVKIIQPAWEGEKSNFITNIEYELGGLKKFTNTDTLYITKSIKDYLVLIQLGINVRYVPSETYPITTTLINLCSSFKKVIFIYDNDKTGINSLEILKEKWGKLDRLKNTELVTYHLPIKLLTTQKIKDPFDMVKKRRLNGLKIRLKKDKII